MIKSSFTTFTLRLTEKEAAIADKIAAARGISRAEAIRLCIQAGGTLVVGQTSINVPRVLMTLEILVAECMDRVERRDPEAVDRFVEIATRRMGGFHA